MNNDEKYVVVGVGYKQVFSAPDDHAAYLQAVRIARENNLGSWLCYNRNLDLIGSDNPFKDDKKG